MSTFLKKKTQNNDDSWLKKMSSMSRVWNKRKSERAAGISTPRVSIQFPMLHQLRNSGNPLVRQTLKIHQ